MLDATRIEHLFTSIGGVARILPGLPRHYSQVNDRGELLALLAAGLDPEQRADILAAIILRHAAARVDPREAVAFLHRALRAELPMRVDSVPASVARWIPHEVR